MSTNQFVVPITKPVVPPSQAASKPSPYNKPADGVPFFTPAQDPPSGTALDPQPNGTPIPKLFTPIKIRDVTFQNRIFLSPLCQYSCLDGFQQPWNTAHLGGIISRGPGLSIIEASAVQARGRITPEDAGIWSDAHIPGLMQLTQFAHSQSQKIGIQLGHGGRKASTVTPWLSYGSVADKDVNGWPDDVIAPSAIPFSDKYCNPREMTLKEIEEVKADFIRGAQRAVKAGFDVVEIHNAHGYLLHSFMSPVSNKRTDKYGGSFENRVRLSLEIAEGVRAAIPEGMPLFYRISATDWLENNPEFPESWTVKDSIKLSELLAERGVDLIDVSSGGMHPSAKFFGGPGYQAPMSKEIKKALGDKILLSAVGTITEGKQAEEILTSDTPLDVIFAGRMFQKDPALVWHWAEDLDISIYVAKQIGWGFGGRGSGVSKKSAIDS